MQGDELKEYERIGKKTGNKKSSCSCEKCQEMCKTAPCFGTPKDIEKLIDSGYGAFLQIAVSCTGWPHGYFHPPMTSIQFKTKPDGSCVMFNNGLCLLHNTGLKPTEGVLAHHSEGLTTFDKSVHWEVLKEWCLDENEKIIDEIFKRMKHGV